MCKYVFSDNYGIIHEYSEGHDKCKQRDHIYCCIEKVEQKKSAHKGDWNAGRDPECQTEIQKESQSDENQNNPLSSVAKQQIYPVLNHG